MLYLRKGAQASNSDCATIRGRDVVWPDDLDGTMAAGEVTAKCEEDDDVQEECKDTDDGSGVLPMRFL